MALKLYGANWCPDSQRVKQLLGAHHLDYDWVDIDEDAKGAEEVAALNHGDKSIPTLVLADHSTLTNPSDEELVAKLQLSAKKVEYNDLAIIGAGPTGMAAAIYTTREDIKTVLYEKQVAGGMAGLTDRIDNYPGFPEGISGLELAANMAKQAQRFGADFQTGVEIQGITNEGRYKKLKTSAGGRYAKSVLIATGSDYRKLGVPGEKELTSRGVHYCATCDGPFYRDKEIIIVGGGNSAMQEGLFLTKFASHITMLVRSERLKGSEILIAKTCSKPEISIRYNTTVTGIKPQDGRGLSVSVTSQGQVEELKTDGMFIFIGMVPNTHWLHGSIDIDTNGFVTTDKTFETSMPGVFAAGDVRAGATLQLASATGEGVTAALMIREYLKEQG